jgi:hypothetical protein
MIAEDSRDYAEQLAKQLRNRLDKAFRPDTTAQGLGGAVPSAGHCAVASVVVHNVLGGELVSAIVGGISHWFNRVRFGERVFDIDLTADQFDAPPVIIADADELYPGTRVRPYGDLTVETLIRAARLAHRAGFEKTEAKLKATIQSKVGSSSHIPTHST